MRCVTLSTWFFFLFWGGGSAPLQAGIAEALLTCVFQGSVIWNSQMSPWQMNGKAGLWKWAFMHYVGYSSMYVWNVDACYITAALCLDHRTYCNTEEKHEHRHLTQIQAIKLFMTSRRPNLKCELCHA